MGLTDAIEATTVAELRRRGSFKWTAPGPDGFGAAVAEMDFGAADCVLDALAGLSATANFGYLADPLQRDLAAATAEFVARRYGWDVDPTLVHSVPDVLKVLELSIAHFSRAGAPVVLPTPAYPPFLKVPSIGGRGILEVPLVPDDAGVHRLDLDGIDAALRAGGDLVVLCNPYNPLGRVFARAELVALTEVVERHGARVFADEIHAPLVYPGGAHVPYASTSEAAAGHTVTAVSASKAWNLAGLKCAQVILSNERDRAVWGALPMYETHGASNPGVVANIAAYRHGDGWLADALGYLDGNRRLLADLVETHLPGVRYRPPEGTYLAWLDFADLALPGSPGAVITRRSKVLVVDGPDFGPAGTGALRFNFATPRPVLTEMVTRMGEALR